MRRRSSPSATEAQDAACPLSALTFIPRTAPYGSRSAAKPNGLLWSMSIPPCRRAAARNAAATSPAASGVPANTAVPSTPVGTREQATVPRFARRSVAAREGSVDFPTSAAATRAVRAVVASSAGLPGIGPRLRSHVAAALAIGPGRDEQGHLDTSSSARAAPCSHARRRRERPRGARPGARRSPRCPWRPTPAALADRVDDQPGGAIASGPARSSASTSSTASS